MCSTSTLYTVNYSLIFFVVLLACLLRFFFFFFLFGELFMDETYCGDSTKTWFFPLGFSSSSICICTLHSLLLGKNLSYNYIYIHYLLSLINIKVLLFFQNYKTCWNEHHVALCLWTMLSGLYTWDLKFYECSVYFHIYSICELHNTKKNNSLNFYYLK